MKHFKPILARLTLPLAGIGHFRPNPAAAGIAHLALAVAGVVWEHLGPRAQIEAQAALPIEVGALVRVDHLGACCSKF